MMGDTLPEPLVPAEVDLRDFPYMPLDVQRLRDSDLSSTPDAESFRCCVLSWCVSWHQVPAGSLPDDDATLARLLGFGRDQKGWKKIRAADGLHGWVKCNDGRLYHPVVAGKAKDAWASKSAQRARTENARRAREEARQTLLQRKGMSVTESVTETVTESKGEREGEGEGKGYNYTPPLRPPARKTAADVTTTQPDASDESFLASLQANIAYQGLSVLTELAKLQAWCQANGKVPTRKRFVNWLNRADRPMEVKNAPIPATTAKPGTHAHRVATAQPDPGAQKLAEY